MKREEEIHRVFDFTLLLKGLHAIIELAGGAFLYVAGPDTLTRILGFFIRGEISEDPHDFIARYLMALAQEFGGSSRSFAAFYLVSHGIVNGLVVLGLWKEKIWAYPISIAVIAAFIAYQCYLFTFGFSLWVAVITIFDVVVLLLALHEYKILKKKAATRKR